MRKLDARTEKDFFNTLVYWVAKPYVLASAFMVLLTPSVWFANALESGADFLNIGAGARASAMGSAYTAVTGDITSIHYNPAGLYGVKRELAFTHADWVLDGSYNFMAVSLPFRKGSAALSFTRLNYGGFDARGDNGESAGGFRASDNALSLALARDAGDGFSVGLGGKFLFSNIAGYGASAFAFDLGAVKQMSGLPVSVGLAVKNIGSGMKFASEQDSLPLNVSAGMNLKLASAMNLMVDMKRMVRENRTDFSVGTEYGMSGPLSLRSGYSSATGSGSSSLGGLTGGIGIKIADMQFDYSFTPFDRLDTVKRFSMNCKF